jgi:hypothetical protein
MDNSWSDGQVCASGYLVRQPGRFRQAVAAAAGQHERHRLLEIDQMARRDVDRPDLLLRPQYRTENVGRMVFVPQIDPVASLWSDLSVVSK